MAELTTIIRQLQKGKNTEANLALFGNHMMNSSNRLSFTRLAMNYSTLYETAAELFRESGERKELLTEIRELNFLAETACREGICGELQEEAVKRADALRKRLTGQMEELTFYADRFTVEEYVRNRREYCFKEKTPLFSDEELKNQILQYVTSEKDQAVMRDRLSAVIGELPLRMARQRFFQILQDGMSVYKGADRQTVEDLLSMIQSVSLLASPKETGEIGKSLASRLEELESLERADMTKEEYDRADRALKAGMEELDHLMSLFLMMQETVNDLYVIFLSAPYALYEVEERETSKKLVQYVWNAFQKESWEPLPEKFYEGFSALEGLQEHLYESFSACDGALEEIYAASRKLIESLMLDKIYGSLRRIRRLLSDSRFVPLENTEKGETAEEEFLAEKFASLKMELEPRLKEMSRMKARAVMSRVLALLPPFLNTYEELENYVESSLASCSDRAERLACEEILQQIMME